MPQWSTTLLPFGILSKIYARIAHGRLTSLCISMKYEPLAGLVRKVRFGMEKSFVKFDPDVVTQSFQVRHVTVAEDKVP